MGVIKLSLPDQSAKGKSRLANAKGKIINSALSDISSKYTSSGTTRTTSNPVAIINGGGKFISAQMGGGGPGITPPVFFSPIHTPQNWQTPSKRKEIYIWSRHYYDNEPKVAAGIDFYAQFPMNGFTLECRNRDIQRYYEELVKDLKLNHWLKLISHEYFLIGDVFPFLEIDCKICKGSGVKKDGTSCNHPDGKFKSITILNPESVEVKDSVLPDIKEYELIPDEDLIKIISTREPKAVYDRLSDAIKHLVSSGSAIPLSRRSVSHIKHAESAYAKYGTSMLRRLFTILAYKTKLMTANWIVAERLILPVRIVKIGNEQRPAGPEDIADMQAQLMAVANDPNMTIVTHHAFEFDWYGAEGKIHNIDSTMEWVGKEILDGLMLNQAILNGEMQGYAGAAVGVETLIKRLDAWRDKLSEWIYDHIFKPTAMMQGFVDEKQSEALKKTVYLYPTIKWNNLQLRDKSSRLQMLMQLFAQGLISGETLLKEFDIDYDKETEQKRNEQISQIENAPPAAGGGMPPGGMDAGGGMPVPPAGGPPMEGGAGGPPAPGAAPSGPAPGQTASNEMKVYKKGKAPKQAKKEDLPTPTSTTIRLTKIEQKMWKMLQNMRIPYKLYAQFKQYVPGQTNPFVLDFAFPDIGVGIEADGKIWHEQDGAKERDAERDRKLASYGWRIVRFNEDAINSNLDEVQKVVESNIKEAADERLSQRKKAFFTENIRYAQIEPNCEVYNEYSTFDSSVIQNIFGVESE